MKAEELRIGNTCFQIRRWAGEEWIWATKENYDEYPEENRRIHLPEGETWKQFMQRFRPDISEEESDYILWNETCYPFGTEEALKQLYDLLNKN